jgi:DNA mismatch endonuclease (patch repair protein)
MSLRKIPFDEYMRAPDPIRRSENMRRIRSKDTKPERALRSLLHCAGYRFRIHRSNLPGSPDIVFPARRKAIFVHGCFWHQHSRCGADIVPATRREYWVPKLKRNQDRDRRAKLELARIGWKSLTVWECEIEKNPAAALRRSMAFLD